MGENIDHLYTFDVFLTSRQVPSYVFSFSLSAHYRLQTIIFPFQRDWLCSGHCKCLKSESGDKGLSLPSVCIYIAISHLSVSVSLPLKTDSKIKSIGCNLGNTAVCCKPVVQRFVMINTHARTSTKACLLVQCLEDTFIG